MNCHSFENVVQILVIADLLKKPFCVLQAEHFGQCGQSTVLYRTGGCEKQGGQLFDLNAVIAFIQNVLSDAVAPWHC